MITWGYIAGCIDCDGWITFSKIKRKKIGSDRTYTIGITQSKRHERGMVQVSNFLNVNNIGHCFYEREQTWRKDEYNVTPMLNVTIRESDSLIRLLTKIIPFLAFKKEKAKECLDFLKNHKTKCKTSDDLEKETVYPKRMWTQKEIKRLTVLVAENYNNIAIASILKRSANSVAKKINRLGLSRWRCRRSTYV